MTDAKLLASRRGVVLGVSGTNSVGFQIARTFRNLGAEVAVTYRPSRREECAPLCEAEGFEHVGVDFDDDASIAAAFAAIGARWERLDFLVHTIVHVPAGVLDRPLLAVTRREFSAAADASVYSLIAACRAAAPLLERSSSPRVLALTSSGSSRTMPGYHLAGITKAALDAAIRYIAAELGPKGVLANAVSFSLLPTDGAAREIGSQRVTAARAYAAKRSVTRRPLEVDHVTGAVAFLASALCENVTGEVLTVDGGLSLAW
jgi:enoyl-[acyl-carrier protein] reductase I